MATKSKGRKSETGNVIINNHIKAESNSRSSSQNVVVKIAVAVSIVIVLWLLFENDNDVNSTEQQHNQKIEQNSTQPTMQDQQDNQAKRATQGRG